MSSNELETRLFYIAHVLIRRPLEEIMLMPLGFFLDLWALHRIFNGWAQQYREVFIDEIFPF